MKSALLVGNGFTSQLIKEYSNVHMMRLLHDRMWEICAKCNRLFEPFRENILCDVQEAGLLYNTELISYIKDKLDTVSIGDTDELVEKYFINYGLIYETQQAEISSVENLLKVIQLFKEAFSDDVIDEVTRIVNRIYYNEGNNGLSAVSLSSQQPICDWLSQYNWIFTTNFDCVLDDACCEESKVKHLHGGFYMLDRYKISNHKLLPEDAYLVWGIDGVDKKHKIKGGPLVANDGKLFLTRDGKRFIVKSLLETYLDSLRGEAIERLDIFGYSGQNDQHINKAVSQNQNIKEVCFFCDKKDVGVRARAEEIKKRFSLSENVTLKLAPWSEIWDRICPDKND